MTNKANRLIEFLIEKKRTTANNFVMEEILNVAKEIKIDEKEYFYDRLARAAVLMAVGVNHEKLQFAKDKFYKRIYSFCRSAVKVEVIVKKLNAK